MKELLFIVVCIIFLVACNAYGNHKSTDIKPDDSAEAVYRKITADEARLMMESSDDFILLDVRTADEFKEARIKGAVLIPDYEIAERAASALPDKNKLILIYCRSGRRSAIAAHELIKLGYINVYDFGGILDWQYETVSGE